MTHTPSPDNALYLSRRRILAGLGAVGIASAGAGIGTTAYFSDTESFEGNTLTAGSLDLLVDYYSYWDQDIRGTGSVSGTADGPAVTAVLDDVKPGDNGKLAFCFTIDDNPAYLWACGDLVANDENGQSEPEAEIDTMAGGELAQAIQVDVDYCDLAEDLTGGAEEGFDPKDLSKRADVFDGSLAEFLALIQAGVPLDGDATGGLVEPGMQAPFDGLIAEGEVDNPCVCIDWIVPTDVGNEIQTDSVVFDLLFYAEQARHNDGTMNPCADATYEAPYINPEDHDTKIEGTLRLDIAYGQEYAAFRVQMDDDNTGPKMSTPLNSVTNFWMPFDVDQDGTMDFQLRWYPGADLISDPFGYKENNGSWSGDMALPAGVMAFQNGEYVTFLVPRSMLNDGDATFDFGVHMSSGGEGPFAAISTESSTGAIGADKLLTETLQ